MQPRLCRVAGRDAWHVYDDRRRISTGTSSRTEAERFLADYLTAKAAPTRGAAGVSAILARYLVDRRAREIPGADRLMYAHKPLSAYFGDRPPEAVTEAACLAYGASRHVAPSTVRTELQALRAALRWSEGAAAPTVRLPPRPPSRDRWLTRPEAERLIESCRAPHIRLFVIVALHTAARRGAVLGLTWDRVDLDGRRIDYNEPGRAATRKGRTRVPINTPLHAALVDAKATAETRFVIEWAGGQVVNVKHGFHDACTRAGLTGVTPHTLRHTAATWMVQRGVDLWQVAGFLGHTDTRMIETVYGHHSPEYLAGAASALE